MTEDELKAIEARYNAATPGYEITSDGLVFSIATNWRGYGKRRMDAPVNSKGYPSVRLTINGMRKRYLVHALVAKQYLPPRPSLQHEIRHLDGNKLNNNVENLCWGTRKDNARDRELHGNTAKGSRNGFSKLSEIDVSEIRKLLSAGTSQRKVATAFNVSQRAIGRIFRMEQWNHVI